jgi:hypothetical protein
MPFFAVLLVDVQRTFRLLTDEQYGGNLDRINTAKRAWSLTADSRIVAIRKLGGLFQVARHRANNLGIGVSIRADRLQRTATIEGVAHDRSLFRVRLNSIFNDLSHTEDNVNH